ncbi:MAG: helical backbone metal receptor [Eubacteriaceae bacterium]
MYKKTKKLLCILLTLLILISFASCSNTTSSSGAANTAYPLSITDDLGNNVTIDAKPLKIVSTSPAVTEILFALGLDDEIVGVSSSCDYPQAAKSKPHLFDFSGPNIESIIQADPDIILSDVAYGIPQDTKLLLENSGIKIILMTYTSVDDVLDNITLIGRITDKNKEAAKLVSQISKDIEKVAAKAKKQEPKSVFINIGGYYTPGADTFINDLITTLGANNIAESLGSGWIMISTEKLIEADPNVYIDLSVVNSGDLPTDSIILNLSALKNNKYYSYSYSSNETSVLSRPGPRMAEALQLLYDDIYGK